LTADNQIDTTTGTGKLKAVFDNKDSVLFPNQFVNIHLVLENRPNALVVPTAAIQTGLNGSMFVWVVNDNGKGGQVAQMQPVKVALAEGQQTILDSGPEPGSKVVVDGADRLRPDQPVTISSNRQRPNQTGRQGAAQPSDQTQNPFANGGNRQPGSGNAAERPQNPSSNQRQHQ
jgi:multidrug efflux system membrane fusion protein